MNENARDEVPFDPGCVVIAGPASGRTRWTSSALERCKEPRVAP